MTYQIESLKKLAKLELPEGQRVCRVIAKKGKIGGNDMESQGVVIPVFGIAVLNALVSDAVGAEFLRGAVESVQDSLVRRAVEAGKMAIFAEQIDLGAMLAAMQVANESSRFSKESIASWFADHMREPLAAAIGAKFIGIAADKRERMLTDYLGSFQILAGRTPSMTAGVKAGLLRAMEFLPEDHDHATAVELANRLAVVVEPSAMLELL